MISNGNLILSLIRILMSEYSLRSSLNNLLNLKKNEILFTLKRKLIKKKVKENESLFLARWKNKRKNLKFLDPWKIFTQYFISKVKSLFSINITLLSFLVYFSDSLVLIIRLILYFSHLYYVFLTYTILSSFELISERVPKFHLMIISILYLCYVFD
jgi:hypothetical protein